MKSFRFKHHALSLTYIVLLFSFSLAPAASLKNLADEPLIISKDAKPLSDKAASFLNERDGSSQRVWMFFTDKGFTDSRSMQTAAASVQLTEKALARRAKVGLDHPVFADFPVATSYIEQIKDLGAKHRRSSRWLNAASFLIPADKLDEAASLPFVARIQPIATFAKIEVEEFDATRDGIPGALSPDALSYGQALGQLKQINVLPVHAKGYTGKGVTLTIMDTGFRKSHETFTEHWANGRVLAEYDFIFNDENTANEAGDVSSQWNHGTLIWSVSGGQQDNKMYGPAYEANFILCKTEDLRSETPVEEDNWIAALEFADSIGTDVITTSLGYTDWYPDDSMYNGAFATITLAANTTDGLGIVMCNSMGNAGPGAMSLSPPADAFNILSVGAVNATGTIASFSSRGPTYDGRIKPEVCAQGVGTYAASATGDGIYTAANGTSLSTPLIAGAVCLLVEARPSFPPALIRQALMETASRSGNPGNDYGWGIIDLDAALSWGADFSADVTLGEAPVTVQFTSSSSLNPTNWQWDFGDGDSSTEENPNHIYNLPGSYSVTLTVTTSYGDITTSKPNYVAAMGDTLYFESDSSYAGKSSELSVYLKNSQSLNRVIIPFDLPDSPFALALDSVILGERTTNFENISYLSIDQSNEKYTIELLGGSALLTPGDGEILKLVLKPNRSAYGGLTNEITSSVVSTYEASLQSDVMSYGPMIVPGQFSTKFVLRCDVDASNDEVLDIGDLTMLISYLFMLSYIPPTLQSADCDKSGGVDMSDINFLISYLFLSGPAPESP